ncbi:hypothetical protein TNCV_650981 [Trichonephila clavipes]|nr:hypothetical protein TNCV_650981 [Trichonephila clavipes]
MGGLAGNDIRNLETELNSSLKSSIWFHSFDQSRHCATTLQTEASSGWVLWQQLNGYRDTRCPSSRRLAMFRGRHGGRIEGAVCVRTAANKAVGSTRAYRMM